MDQERKCYVMGGSFTRSVIEAWANENAMKVDQTAVTLSGGEQVFELDTQCNEDLRIAARPLRMGYGCPSLMNGKRRIGSVKCDRVLNGHEMAACYVVFPEIRDR